MKVFFDTGVFIALFVSQEKYHKQVAQKYDYYRHQRALFYTSYYILDELFTRFIYDFGAKETKKVIDLLVKSLEKEEIKVLDIDEETFKKSLIILLKFSEHKVSVTDATTYTLFKDLELDEVFTLDSDFKKIGLKTSF
jgi:predicted nucleic acid-binding protein